MYMRNDTNMSGNDRSLSPRRCYGLPCVKCHTYYFADLDSCPVCNARDRIGRPALPQDIPADAPMQMGEPSSNFEATTVAGAAKNSLSDCWSIILGKPKLAASTSTISTGQLRARFAYVMEEVAAQRNSVLITRRGKPLVRIIPVEAPELG
jgi:prevent-host-death family protein